VFHGEPTAEDAKTRDLSWNERLIVAPLIILIVLLGVFPKPLLDRITPSVNQLVVHVDQVTNTKVPAGLGPRPVAAATPRHDPSLAIAAPRPPADPGSRTAGPTGGTP
jgi:NADH-quinone oxidoreductase subunit M